MRFCFSLYESRRDRKMNKKACEIIKEIDAKAKLDTLVPETLN